MRVVHESPAELVLKDNSTWITAICAGSALALILFGIVQAEANFFLVAALFLIFATIAAYQTTFIFDGIQRVVRWNGYKLFRSASGTIRFDDITDITTEAKSGGEGIPGYRLAILTAQGAVPMAYAYKGRSDAYSALRNQILEFIRPGLHQRDAHRVPDAPDGVRT